MPGFKLSRRDFLQISASSLAASAFGAPSWMPRLAFLNQEAAPSRDVLVCIFLRGGWDGLNVVIPQFESNYYRARPNLAIPESTASGDVTAIDLDGHFALHPALAPLKDSWDVGDLAIIHAAGSPDPSHSHFDAQDYMERGTPGEKNLSSGWIGRYLETFRNGNGHPLRAVGMGGVRQTSLQGQVPVTSLQSIADFHLQGKTDELFQLQGTLASLYQLEGSLREEAENTIQAIDTLAKINIEAYIPAGEAKYPEGDFGNGLMQIAQLVKSGLGLEVACIDLGGFDTHANQGGVEGQLPGLLKLLGEGMAALHRDMLDEPQSVSLVVMSEFGRRVAENGSGGTDHGHGSVMLGMGAGVNGGKVYSNWPGLDAEDLYGPGDLQVTIDFRDVLGELIANRLGNSQSLETIFPDFDVTSYGIFAQRATG